MSEQITAEIVTEEPQTETVEPTAPATGDETPATQIEDEPAEAEEPAAPEEPTGPLAPEVTATVTQGASGVWAVNVFTQHPDTLDVSVNGRAVWRGIP